MTHRCGLDKVRATAVRRAVIIAAVMAAAMLAPSIAFAHVTVDSTQPNGDGTTTIVLSFDHGCTDSPTESLDVAPTDGVEILSGSTSIPGWRAERILPTRINFLGDPVASGEVAQVEIVARLTGVAGQRIYFPTYQRCASGNGFSWTDTAVSAQYPAPEVIVTSAMLAPAAVSSDSGADRTQVVIGIAGLAILLGAAGAWAGARARQAS